MTVSLPPANAGLGLTWMNSAAHSTVFRLATRMYCGYNFPRPGTSQALTCAAAFLYCSNFLPRKKKRHFIFKRIFFGGREPQKSVLGFRCFPSVITDFVTETFKVLKCKKPLHALKEDANGEGRGFLMLGWDVIPGSS